MTAASAKARVLACLHHTTLPACLAKSIIHKLIGSSQGVCGLAASRHEKAGLCGCLLGIDQANMSCVLSCYTTCVSGVRHYVQHADGSCRCELGPACLPAHLWCIFVILLLTRLMQNGCKATSCGCFKIIFLMLGTLVVNLEG